MDENKIQENGIKPLQRSYTSKLKLSKNLVFKRRREISNINTESTLSEFQHNICKPYLISYPTLKKQYPDPYLELLYKKHVFNTDVERVRHLYLQYLKKKRCNIEVLKKYYENMQNLLDNNPDPYFNGDYNWYYSGGNMGVTEMEDKNLVFHTTKGRNLSVAAIHKTQAQWTLYYKKKLLKTESNIYEIQSLLKNNNLLVGYRQKKTLKLLNINKPNSVDLKFNEVVQQELELPIVSFNINPYKNQLVTVDCRQKARIHDLVKDDIELFKISKTFNTLGENWAQIRYLDTNLLIYANNISYNITDLRTKQPIVCELSNKICSKQNFTNFCCSDHDLYLISDESVTQIDCRMHKIVNKWSHLIKGGIYLSDCKKNLICLASTYPHEKVLLGSGENVLYLPVSIPSLNETLDYCLADEIIDKSFIIRKRNMYSNTGIKFLTNNDIITVNSIGDLSINELDSNFDLHKNMQIFKDFSQKLTPPPLNFIDKCYIKDLNNVLNPESSDMTDHFKNQRAKNVERTNRFIKKNILGCKTTLSNVWDLDFSIDNIEEIDATSNVQAWLSGISVTDRDVIDPDILEEKSIISSKKSKDNESSNDGRSFKNLFSQDSFSFKF